MRRRKVTMNKSGSQLYQDLMQGLREVEEYLSGALPERSSATEGAAAFRPLNPACEQEGL
jgi:hypothetical protein